MTSKLDKYFYILTALLTVSVFTSIAATNAMVILGLASLATVWIYQKITQKTLIPFFKTGIELPLLIATGLAILAYFVNGTELSKFTNALYDLRILFTVLLVTMLASKYVLGNQRFYYLIVFIVILMFIQTGIQQFLSYDFFRTGYPFVTHGIKRTTGFFSHPNTLAFFAGTLFVFFYVKALFEYKDKKMQRLTLVVCALLLMMIAFTQTRIAWIGIAITSFITTLYFLKQIKPFLIVIFSLGLLIVINPVSRERFKSIPDSEYQNNKDRIYLYQAHFDIFKDYPILGMGNKEFKKRDRPYYLKYPHLQHEAARGTHAHNEFLHLLSSRGILGLLVFCYLFGYILKTAFQVYKRIPVSEKGFKALALGSLIAQIYFHISAQTSVPLEEFENATLFMVITGLVFALNHKYPQVSSSKQ